MIDLKRIPFFKHFPEDLLARLSAGVEILNLDANETLIAQGTVSSSLYFLSQGKLAVYVDGAEVAVLDQYGDLVGEMSLISKKASSAEIRSLSPVVIFKLSRENIEKMAQEGGDVFQLNLYRVYADVLSQKLDITNQRAKLAEKLNEKLVKTQEELQESYSSLEEKVSKRTRELKKSNDELRFKNEEIKTSHQKIEEIFKSSHRSFKAFDRILNTNLKPLVEKVKNYNNQNKMTSKQVSVVQGELENIVAQMQPFSKIYGASRSMKSKKVLLAEGDRKQQNIAKMALGGTGVQLDIAASAEEAEEYLATQEYEIFIFNDKMLDVAAEVAKNGAATSFVYATSADVPEYVPKILDLPFFPNIVSRDTKDRQFTIKNFVTTVSKLTSHDYFGIEKYLAWGVEVHDFYVSNSSHRPESIEKITDYFSSIGVRKSRLESVSVVIEELLMNAIYDAPHDDDGKPMFNHLMRVNELQLDEPHRPLVRFGSDGVLMAVSVEDPFGRLDGETVFRYLERCYQGGDSLNDGDRAKGGGGRGLHQIIENSDLVVFNIKPNQRCEVIALFNTDRQAAECRNPNLHFFKAS